MSDTINVLNQIVHHAGQRQAAGDGANEEQFAANIKLLETVAEIAGDCLEEHKAASLRAKPRKQRVYKQIVKEIAVHFCDEFDDTEAPYHACEEIRTILHNFAITTKDFEGKEVKI